MKPAEPRVLTVNGGSSSIKFALYEGGAEPRRIIEGAIERISPAVDPATRQIPILVSVPNAEGALLAGLFAIFAGIVNVPWVIYTIWWAMGLLGVIAASRKHFEKEERIVFPLAERILKTKTLTDLGSEWRKRRETALK